MKKIIVYDHDGKTDFYHQPTFKNISTVKKYNRFNLIFCNLYATLKNQKIKVLEVA